MANTIIGSGTTSSGLFVSGTDSATVQSGGIAISTTVSGSNAFSPAALIVANGGSAVSSLLQYASVERNSGTEISAQLLSSGSETVFTGGSVIGDTISTGGLLTVSSGATASALSVLSGAQVLAMGGTVSGGTIAARGVIYASGSGLILGVTDSGFIAVSSGGTASNAIVAHGGNVNIAAGGTAISSTVLSGGTEGLLGSNTIASGAIISGGGKEVVSHGTAISSVVSSGGLQIVYSGGTASGTTLVTGGAIDFAALTYGSGGTAVFDSTTSTLTVTEGASSASMVLAGSYDGYAFQVASGGTGLGTKITLAEAAPCFCAGTRLQTEDGEVAVEELAEGARLLTVLGASSRRVRWIGHRDTALARHPRPWDVQPVRILADAFAPGMPTRDLRLSPDHAIYADGHLIPVRALINGATIVQETAERVTYYHVELENADGTAAHDVLLAQGMPVESYLDTGNRSAFANGGDAVMAHPNFAQRVWDSQACAPLAISGPVVESLRQLLVARAVSMGFSLTDDADAGLLADGVLVRPEVSDENTLRFVLTRPAQTLHLVSRRWVPAHINPASEDWRPLGMAVQGLTLDGKDVELAEADRGWHAAEPGLRWTDGKAWLPEGASHTVDVRVWRAARYWQARPDDALLRRHG